MSGDYKPLTMVEACDICDTPLVYDIGEGDEVKLVKFTAHDAEFCNLVVRDRVRTLKAALEMRIGEFCEIRRREISLMVENSGLREKVRACVCVRELKPDQFDRMERCLKAIAKLSDYALQGSKGESYRRAAWVGAIAGATLRGNDKALERLYAEASRAPGEF